METERAQQNDGIGELPPHITVDLTEDVRSYWRDRLRQHTGDAYAGVRLSKLPEDLRTYEHLLWSDRPDTVIEIGTQYGASALWFRDRLRTLQAYGLIGVPRVVTLDIDQSPARHNLPRADPDYGQTIHVVEGDVRDPSVTDKIAELVGERCFVVEDSAHEYDTTYAALVAFARFVPPGGYLVVEDGSVDVATLRLIDEWPRGVLPALRDWLGTEEGREFDVRRDLELYGITGHSSGFLQRRGGDRLLERDYGADGAVVPHALDVRLEEQLGERRRLTEQLADAERRLAGVPNLQVRIAELEGELDSARRATEEAQAQVRKLDERLTRGQTVLTNVFNSPSWRVTKPLRATKKLLRG